MSGNFCENMKIIILLTSMALVSATKVNPPPRSVNVALETSFVFDPKDLNDNKSLVNHVRRFLDNLYKTLENQSSEKLFRTETKPRVPEGEFMEVMENIGLNFLNMSGPKIKEALDTLHVVVKNITEKQPPSLLQVLPTRTQYVIKDLIASWMQSDPEDIKVFINSTVRDHKPLLNTFVRRMNSYYNADDVKKLNKILKKFRRYIDNNRDTTKIVKKLVHNTIFKKYDNLDDSAKVAVMGDLKKLSKFLIEKNGLTEPETRRNSPSKEFVDKAESSDDTNTALRRFIDEKISNAREKTEDKKKSTHEFAIGNVELFVEQPQNS